MASFASLDLPSAAYQADERGDEFLASYREPVILDEVHYAPGLFRHLKVAVDAARSRHGRFLMTGSQKFSLMRALSESLAGQNGRARLIEAKWTERLGDPRAIRSLLRVRNQLGAQAATEHWLAARTQHPHTLPGAPGVRLVDAVSFTGWFDGSDT